MARYVWANGCFRDRATGTPMGLPVRDGLCTPTVMSDIPEYRSPVGDHATITSRSQQRDDLARSDCVLSPPPAKPKSFENPKWARKRGAEHRLSEAARILAKEQDRA